MLRGSGSPISTDRGLDIKITAQGWIALFELFLFPLQGVFENLVRCGGDEVARRNVRVYRHEFV